MLFLQGLLFSIPEAVAVSWLAFALSGSKANWQKVIIIGVITGTAVAILRPLLGGIYIINVLVYGVILTALCIVFKISALWESVTAVLLTLPIYTLIEFLSLTVLSARFQIEPSAIMENIYLKLSWFSPQLIITMLLAFILYKNKISLFSKDMEA